MFKKIVTLSLSILLMLGLTGCAKKQTAVVGEVIDIAVGKTSGTIAKYLWAFKTKPSDSKLDPRDFLPSDDAEAVSFVPDVPGAYEVIVAMVDANGKESNEIFEFEVTMPDGADNAKQIEVTEVKEDTVPKTPVQDANVKEAASDNWKNAPAPTADQKKAYRPAASKPAQQTPASQSANLIPKKKDVFTIQIASFKTYDKAQQVSNALKSKGFDAMVQRAYFKDKDEIWYRVRVGNFTEKAKAREQLATIQKSGKFDGWIDNVREDF